MNISEHKDGTLPSLLVASHQSYGHPIPGEQSVSSLTALAGVLSHNSYSGQALSGSENPWDYSEPAEDYQAHYSSTLAYGLKRAVDVLASFVLLVALAPLFAFCMLLVLASSRGRIFFNQKRVGYRGQAFQMWKFRTMHHNAAELLAGHLEKNPEARSEWAATQKLRSDPRVTRLGSFMRRYSLDELPQFWNVLMGDMSLVGPRPVVSSEIRLYGDGAKYYYAVRPGLTGLWQVSGRSHTSYAERVELDKTYVNHWSPRLDFAISLKTFRVLLTGDGAY